jgi:hypothetical protein
MLLWHHFVMVLSRIWISQQCHHCTRLKRSEPKLVCPARKLGSVPDPIFPAPFSRHQPAFSLAIIGDVAFRGGPLAIYFPAFLLAAFLPSWAFS